MDSPLSNNEIDTKSMRQEEALVQRQAIDCCSYNSDLHSQREHGHRRRAPSDLRSDQDMRRKLLPESGLPDATESWSTGLSIGGEQTLGRGGQQRLSCRRQLAAGRQSGNADSCSIAIDIGDRNNDNNDNKNTDTIGRSASLSHFLSRHDDETLRQITTKEHDDTLTSAAAAANIASNTDTSASSSSQKDTLALVVDCGGLFEEERRGHNKKFEVDSCEPSLLSRVKLIRDLVWPQQTKLHNNNKTNNNNKRPAAAASQQTSLSQTGLSKTTAAKLATTSSVALSAHSSRWFNIETSVVDDYNANYKQHLVEKKIDNNNQILIDRYDKQHQQEGTPIIRLTTTSCELVSQLVPTAANELAPASSRPKPVAPTSNGRLSKAIKCLVNLLRWNNNQKNINNENRLSTTDPIERGGDIDECDKKKLNNDKTTSVNLGEFSGLMVDEHNLNEINCVQEQQATKSPILICLEEQEARKNKILGLRETGKCKLREELDANYSKNSSTTGCEILDNSRSQSPVVVQLLDNIETIKFGYSSDKQTTTTTSHKLSRICASKSWAGEQSKTNNEDDHDDDQFHSSGGNAFNHNGQWLIAKIENIFEQPLAIRTTTQDSRDKEHLVDNSRADKRHLEANNRSQLVRMIKSCRKSLASRVGGQQRLGTHVTTETNIRTTINIQAPNEKPATSRSQHKQRTSNRLQSSSDASDNSSPGSDDLEIALRHEKVQSSREIVISKSMSQQGGGKKEILAQKRHNKINRMATSANYDATIDEHIDQVSKRHNNDTNNDYTSVERDVWGKNIEFLLAVIGFAVDLGNVWRFPYVCYKNGGGAFLIPYTILFILGGLPIFYLEMSLGQYFSSGCLTIWRRVCPIAKGIGYSMCLLNFFTGLYYNTIISWAVFFFWQSFTTKNLPWTSCNNSWNLDSCRTIEQRQYIRHPTLNSTIQPPINDNELNSLSSLSKNFTSPTQDYFKREVLQIHLSSGIDNLGEIRKPLAIYLAIVFVFIYFAIWKGVKSTGKAVWITALLPYFILIPLLIRGVFLPGAWSGILYYLSPQWTSVTEPNVWIEAAKQIYFSLGPGFGTLMALSSYNKFNHNTCKDAMIAAGVNYFASFISGFVIFSVLGYMAVMSENDISRVATEGPGLVFEVYPEGLATMQFAALWSGFFFTMVVTLGIDSTFGGLESVITGLCDEYPRSLRRHRGVFIGILIIIIYICSLPTTTNGGNYVIFILESYGTSSLLLIVLIETIVVCWIYGTDRFCSNLQEMSGHPPSAYWRICWKYISPTILLIIFLAACGQELSKPNQLQDNDYIYPDWASKVGLLITCSSIFCIPAYAIYHFIFKVEGSFRECSFEPCSRLQGVALAVPGVDCQRTDDDNNDQSVPLTARNLPPSKTSTKNPPPEYEERINMSSTQTVI